MTDKPKPDAPGSDFGAPRGIAPPTKDILQKCPYCLGKGVRWNDYIQQLEHCEWCDGEGHVKNSNGSIGEDLPLTREE